MCSHGTVKFCSTSSVYGVVLAQRSKLTCEPVLMAHCVSEEVCDVMSAHREEESEACAVGRGDRR